MSNTTTRVRGWKLTRLDGAVLAFTDCDVDLTVGGVTYEASAGLTPSEATASLGMAVDEQEVQGGLRSDRISERDLAAGVYDGARVEVVEIDWQARLIVDVVGAYNLGQVSRTESAFTAELRSRAGVLGQKRGRFVVSVCDAELGDSRCGVNVGPLKATATVAVVQGETDLLANGLPSTGFSGGLLVWTSGDNMGQVQEVRAHQARNVGLWRPPLFTVRPGDGFELVPGCDKAFKTCRERFGNGTNFRGFPYVVGESAGTYATTGEAGLDGGSRNG